MVSGYGRWLRWVLLGMTMALCGVLVGALALIHRSVGRSIDVVNEAQGKALIHNTHTMLHTVEPWGGPPGPEREAYARAERTRVFERLIDQDRDVGRRYIALVDKEGNVIAKAGDSLDPAWPGGLSLREMRINVPIKIGDRMRILDGPLPTPPRDAPLEGRRRGRRARGLPGEGPPPGELPADDGSPRGGPPPGGPPQDELPQGELKAGGAAQRQPLSPQGDGLKENYFVIEFEPLTANQLRSDERVTLVLGGGAGLALALISIVVWRLIRQREALQERFERSQRLASLGEMCAVLAHEIRNPLASLKGHAQLLLEVLPDQSREHKKADRVVREALRLETLSTDLLDFVRAGQVERRAVDPSALLVDSVGTVDPVRFDVNLDAAPESWSLDPNKMRQVLINLLDNAVKATGEGAPRAQATVRVEGGKITFEVRDFGAGITPGEEERLFEPFHTKRVHGTGLGLAVARRIVELHRGVIVAQNHPDGGALFRVSIPSS